MSGVWLGVNQKTNNKKTCVELCAQNLLTILDAIINITMEDLYDHLMRKGSLTMDWIFIQAPKSMRKVVMGTIRFCYSSHIDCVFHILREWVQRDLKLVQCNHPLQLGHCDSRQENA